jgi:hypothetical protein
METTYGIINLTPHEVNIRNEKGEEIKSFPSEGVVRLSTKVEKLRPLYGIPITKTVFGFPEGLPRYQPGRYYIVSQLVKSALPGRGDLLVPAELVRNDKGQIIGCRSLGY